MPALGEIDATLDDVEVADLWARSGAQWLTDPEVPVPGALVRRVCGLVNSLDRYGSGLADLVPAAGLGLLAERAALMGLQRSGRISAGGASRLLRVEDGWFVLSLARELDKQSVSAWLESDLDVRDDPWPTIERIVDARSADELVSRGALLGLPCAVLGEVGDDRPVLLQQRGDAPPRSIAGAVVVNLAALWAGPLCSDVLARAGARVITVESSRRPDGSRLTGRFFRALHGRSESVALDLTAAPGRIRLNQLLLAADVVIEGSRPRALEQMGISADDVVMKGPKVWLSITAHGRTLRAGNRVGFGDDAAAAGGLVGWVDGEPRFIADAVADPLTGLTAAESAIDLLEREGRWLADVALGRVACSASGGWATRHRDSNRPRPRRDPGAAMPLGRDTDSVLRSFGIA